MEAELVVLITDILSNLDNNEQAPHTVKWFKLYNPTDQQVDIASWYFKHETGRFRCLK